MESHRLFWCWRQGIPAFGVNTMPADALHPSRQCISTFGVNITPADALAHKVASASAVMVLAVWDRKQVFSFQI